MKHEEFIESAKKLVADYTNENKLAEEKEKFKPEDVYVVWSTKVLQNSKVLLGTHNSDGMYYEVTLDGSAGNIYFDAYKKEINIGYTL